MAMDDAALGAGTAVEVSNLFTGTWSRGFRVIGREAEGYRLARMSDGSELPALFAKARLRPVDEPSADVAGAAGAAGEMVAAAL